MKLSLESVTKICSYYVQIIQFLTPKVALFTPQICEALTSIEIRVKWFLLCDHFI